MLYCLMLHYFDNAPNVAALFDAALFDIALFNAALLRLHYLMLRYVNVPLFDVAH